jgi:hypothetical protein
LLDRPDGIGEVRDGVDGSAIKEHDPTKRLVQAAEQLE